LANTALAAQTWQEVLPGVWRMQIGKADRPTLTDAAGSKPRADRIEAMPSQPLPFQIESATGVASRDYASARIPLAPGERIYGLGLQMSGCDRRGGVYHLQVDHYASGHDRLHAPTPMYVSSRGYAVFFNSTRPVNVYADVGNRLADPNRPQFRDRNTDPKWDAQPSSNEVEASVQAPGLEVLVFAGPTPMDALRRYNLYCGGGALPPQWALGFWHRLKSLATAKDVVGEVDEFAKRGFPLDVVGLEPGWQSSAYPGTMEWSPKRFPEPKAFLDNLAKRGLHVNLWENPYVAPGSNLFDKLAGRFGSHTVWLGAAPDIYDPKAAKVLRDFHAEKHVALGVSGYKIDEVDGFDVWLWPDHASFPSGPSGLQMRQMYGLLWQKEMTQLFRSEGKRTFGLVRGSNGASTRFPFAIYSDTYDHRQYVTALTNSSLAGVLWCAEVRSADNADEWVRRMQSACLSPIAQLNAWDSGTKPWSFPSVDAPVREAMLLRESLVPYLYTAFAQYWRDGVPPLRPMCLVDGGLETDQYLLGDDLLVAPMFVGESSRTVRLPKGNWVDYRSGRRVGSAETIRVSPAIDEIPLFVREGAAIPTFADALNVSGMSPDFPVTFRCYGSGPYRCTYYEDNGDGYAYEKGDYGLFQLRLDANGCNVAASEGLRKTLSRPAKIVIPGAR